MSISKEETIMYRNCRAAGLTPQEIDISECIVAGMSYGAIAEKFGIADSTVRAHALNIRYKLEAANQVQAAFKLQQLGVGAY